MTCPLDWEVQISQNKKLSEHLYLLEFKCEKLAEEAIPGHFLQVLVTTGYQPFLRRPFTIYKVQDNHIQVLYEVIGEGTSILAKKRIGDSLQVLGPLGNTFTAEPLGKLRIAVGGGIGSAPFPFLASKTRVDYLILGARTAEGLIPEIELTGLFQSYLKATDDGSGGIHGRVTDVLKQLFQSGVDPRECFVYACGPKPMLKALIDLGKQLGFSGEASVDEQMACGIGACLGCMVPTVSGLKTSCKQGTVFTFEELVL